MRSQKEILEKIEQLEKNSNDPMAVQRKHLIRKLEWQHAVKWIHPDKVNDSDFKSKWSESSRLDEKYLLKEMNDFMFAAYEAWLNHDAVRCLVICQYYLVWVWLMGSKEDAFLRHLFNMFINIEHDMGRGIFDEVCNHYGWKIKRFLRDFEVAERNKPRIITGLDTNEGGLILPSDN